MTRWRRRILHGEITLKDCSFVQSWCNTGGVAVVFAVCGNKGVVRALMRPFAPFSALINSPDLARRSILMPMTGACQSFSRVEKGLINGKPECEFQRIAEGFQ
jgi:hypothetical protein